MKKYTIKIFLFFLPLLFIGFTMEFLLRNIPNDYKFKKAYLDENAEEVETLILGNSHAFFGVNPQYFSTNAFNASQFHNHLIMISKY
jgi:hypothetical protein